MKSGFNCIKITCLLLACTFALSGCSAGKATRVQKAERVSKAGETVKETGNASVGLAAPDGIKISYDDTTKTLRISWNPVAGATAYEIKFMSAKTVQLKGTSCSVPNIEEGTEGKLYVRAISANNTYSAWTACSFKVQIELEAPKDGRVMFDGDNSFLIWLPVKGAEGYEINYYGSDKAEPEKFSVQAPSNYFITKINEGSTEKFDIRSYKTINGKRSYSEWIRINYQSPKFKPISDYDLYDACTLDYRRLEAFAKEKKYRLDAQGIKDEHKVMVVISARDDAQHTLKAIGKRILKNAVEGVLEGYYEGVKENAEETYYESDSLKQFVGELNEKAKKNAKKSGFFKTVKSLFFSNEDKDIHVIYQYRYTNLAPEICMVAMPKANHKNFNLEFAQNNSKFRQKDGSYRFTVEGSQQDYVLRITENENYWLVRLEPTHYISLSKLPESQKT